MCVCAYGEQQHRHKADTHPQADGQIAVSAAGEAKGSESRDALAKVYELGARRWRGGKYKSRDHEPCPYTAPFQQMFQK